MGNGRHLAVPPSSQLQLTASGSPLVAPRDRFVETVDEMLASFKLESLVKAAVFHNVNQLRGNPDLLKTWEDQLRPSQMQALLELTQQAGSHTLPAFAGGQTIHWHNKATGTQTTC